MVLKLFKHDFRRIAKYGVPCLIALLCITVLGCVNTSILSSSVDGERMISGGEAVSVYLSVMGIFGVVIAVCAVACVMMIVIYYRFYKSFVSDEAYLTMTLPVTPTQLIVSKLLSAVSWSVIIGAAILVSCIANVFCVPMLTGEFHEMFESLTDIEWDAPSAIYIILNVILTLVSTVEGLLQVFAAILVGSSISNRHKGISAIGAVIAANMLVSFVMSIFNYGVFLRGGFPSLVSTVLTGEVDSAFLNYYLIAQICLFIALAGAFFLISHHCISKNKSLG